MLQAVMLQQYITLSKLIIIVLGMQMYPSTVDVDELWMQCMTLVV